MAQQYVPKHMRRDVAESLETAEDVEIQSTQELPVQQERSKRLAVEPTSALAEAQSSNEDEATPEAFPEAPASDEELTDEEKASESVGRSTAMMSALVIVSRITGFFRTWGQAFALGVTVTSSCYSVANNLPNQLYELVIGGMLVTAFLPVYLSVKQKKGAKGASEYTSNLVSIVLLLMGVITLLGIVFAYQVVWTQSFAANKDFDTDLAVYFFRFFAIEVVLYGLSSIFSGVLNAERDFFWSSVAPIFNNFVTTASFLLYAWLIDKNPQLGLLILAIGNPLGVAVQVVVQMPALKKYGIRLRPFIALRDPSIRDTLSIGVPSLVVMLCSFETVSVMTSSSLSVTAAGASVSYYARLWFTLPNAILAVPITTAMFTELSDYYAHGNMDAYRRGVAVGSSKIFFFMIPFMMYLVIFATPLITILAAGNFDAEGIQLTSSYLQALAISLPFYGVCAYLQKICSSLRRMGLYAAAHVIAAAIQTAICIFLTPVWGLNVVALSSTFYVGAVTVVTYAFLRRILGPIGISSMIAASLRAFALGAAGAALGWGVLRLLDMTGLVFGGSVLDAAVRVVAGGVPAVFVTFGLAILFKVPETDVIRSIAGRILRRR